MRNKTKAKLGKAIQKPMTKHTIAIYVARNQRLDRRSRINPQREATTGSSAPWGNPTSEIKQEAKIKLRSIGTSQVEHT